MLSYQHIYHAGNPADVHKHALLVAMLDYMTAKDKPMSYLETHSGRGLYQLDAAEAVKTGEAAAGIGALSARLADSRYAQVVDAVRAQHGPAAYPGSPLIAAQILRPTDRITLAELHPQEHAALEYAMSATQARIHRQDGFQMAQAICPPDPRRGLLLIDPSYEVKTEYDQIPAHIAKLHRKWNVGVITLWYPILTSAAHLPMLTALEFAGYKDALRHEVRFPPVRDGHRMVGSGMFVINAPWGLDRAAAEISALFAA